MKSSVDKLNRTQYPEHDKTGMEGGIMSAEEDELLTSQEICDLLKIKKSYLYSLTRSKRIPHMKMGGFLLFSKSAIDEWLRSLEVRDVSIQEKE